MRAALIIALALLTTVTACRRAPERVTEAEPAIPVVVEPVRLGTVRTTISAIGVVGTLPDATYVIVAAQPARIAEITKDAGDAVRSGETLVRFEFPSLGAERAAGAASVKAADLRVKRAQLTEGRISMLIAKGAASRREMEDARREVAMAEGELQIATSALAAADAQGQHTTILAPFDGIVTERLHNPGDAVRPDDADPILRLIDPKKVQVMATLPIADAARAVVGAAARAVAEAPPSPGTPRRGFGQAELLRVATRPAPETGAKTVDITLAFDTPTELQPGTRVSLDIDAEGRSNVPLVPAVAVLKDDEGRAVVMVAAGNTAERRQVVIGLVDEENIEILSGLKPGELIITQGHSALGDGTPVSVSAP